LSELTGDIAPSKPGKFVPEMMAEQPPRRRTSPDSVTELLREFLASLESES